MSSESALGRRGFLQAAIFTAGAATVGGGLLSGCSGDPAEGKDTAKTNNSVKLPTYVPYTGVQPDLAGDANGLLNGFLNYPKNPQRTLSDTPLKGGTVEAFTETSSPIPPGVGSNSYWRELNKRLGANLKLTIVPAADLSTKFATLMAGGDLPDFMVPPLYPLAGVAGLPQFLEAKCQNLSSFLGGDAIAEYPYLANLPTAAWKACVYNGGIYGLPVTRGVAGSLMFRRDDMFKKLGVNPDPKSFDEFYEVCKQVSDPKKKRWAISTPGSARDFVQMMLGIANKWKNEGGKLTSYFEDERTKDALDAVRRMWKDELIHPDSTDPAAPWKQWFNAGEVLLALDRYTAWPQYFADNIAGNSFVIGGMRPPKYDGGGFAGTWQSPPINNFTPLRKASTKRIKELLDLANWLAAPFGTEEYLFRKFGLEHTHYDVKNGSPTLNQAGNAQTVLGVRYIVDAPDVLFIPGNPDATRASYDYQKSIMPTSVVDPTVALYSETNSRTGALLDDKLRTNATNDIITGRKPVSSWDDAVKTWRRNGGDTMRGEYEKQL